MAGSAGWGRALNDSIRIIGLELFGYHGVYDHEKQNGQRFLVDLAVWIDAENASVSDDLSQTLDYGELVKAAAAQVQGESVDLIEKLAAKVCNGPEQGLASVAHVASQGKHCSRP